jgi:hypothetical protein
MGINKSASPVDANTRETRCTETEQVISMFGKPLGREWKAPFGYTNSMLAEYLGLGFCKMSLSLPSLPLRLATFGPMC